MNFAKWVELFHGLADELARCGRHDPMSEESRGRFYQAASDVRKLTETFHELSSRVGNDKLREVAK